jgi:hypothetical protein
MAKKGIRLDPDKVLRGNKVVLIERIGTELAV